MTVSKEEESEKTATTGQERLAVLDHVLDDGTKKAAHKTTSAGEEEVAGAVVTIGAGAKDDDKNNNKVGAVAVITKPDAAIVKPTAVAEDIRNSQQKSTAEGTSRERALNYAIEKTSNHGKNNNNDNYDDNKDTNIQQANENNQDGEAVPPPLTLRQQQRIQTQSVPGAFAGGNDIGVHNSMEFTLTQQQQHSPGAADPDPEAPGGSGDLAVANPVDDVRPNLPHASEVNPGNDGRNNSEKQNEQQKKFKTIIFMVGIVVLAGIALAIAFVVGSNDDNDNDGNKDTQFIATGQETEIADAQTQVSPEGTIWLHDKFMNLLPEFARITLQESLDDLDFEAPQYKAMAWLFADPNVDEYPDFRLLQRYAMSTLYFSSKGEQWTNTTNWLSYHHHECLWYSYEPKIEQVNTIHMYPGSVQHEYQKIHNITCRYGDQQHVDHLLLMDNNLQGIIPEELYLLSSLHALDLDLNDLEGTLSTRVAMLPSLQVLALNSNSLSGTVPKEIFMLSNLTELFLEYNGFTGTVSTEVGKLTKMEQLVWDINDFTGTIPTQIGLLSNTLQYFNIAVNNMVGTLPTQLGRLTEVIFLALHDNLELMGTVPTQMGLMTSVVVFHMRDMGLTGTIPTQVGLWNNSLEVLYFHTNFFTGTLPTQLGLMTNAIKLSVNSNQLTGSLPSELGHLSFLGNPSYHSYSQIQRRWGPDWANLLEAHDNAFTGSIPTEYGHIGALTLGLDGNDLSGSIPTELSLHTDLRRLHLSSNSRMTGSIPPELLAGGMWESLFTLKIANIPGMGGALPSELGACTLLSDLVLANCSWTGTIPEELAELAAVDGTNLTLVDLSDNPMLTGVIPEGLCNVGLRFDCSNMLCGCDCSCNSSASALPIIMDGK